MKYVQCNLLRYCIGRNNKSLKYAFANVQFTVNDVVIFSFVFIFHHLSLRSGKIETVTSCNCLWSKPLVANAVHKRPRLSTRHCYLLTRHFLLLFLTLYSMILSDSFLTSFLFLALPRFHWTIRLRSSFDTTFVNTQNDSNTRTRCNTLST